MTARRRACPFPPGYTLRGEKHARLGRGRERSSRSRRSSCRRRSRRAPRCWSRSPIAASATPTCTSGKAITTSAAARGCRSKDRGVTLPLAMGHEIVGRVVKLGPDAKGRESRRSAHRLSLARLRHSARSAWPRRTTCASSRAQPRRLPEGGYGTHVIAPHPRHLVDPGKLDPAVAATYACSGITVYSAIKKAMPLPPDEPIVVVGAGGLGMNAIAVLKALKHQQHRRRSMSARRSATRR